MSVSKAEFHNVMFRLCERLDKLENRYTDILLGQSQNTRNIAELARNVANLRKGEIPKKESSMPQAVMRGNCRIIQFSSPQNS